MKRSSLLLLFLLLLLPLAAAGSSLLPVELCNGSRRPYPAPDSVEAAPDSLIPIAITHVGRHGARFATSPRRFSAAADTLAHHKLTAHGRRVLETILAAIDTTNGRWGYLDSLGVAEQRGIASRLCMAFPQLVVGQQISAISSYVGRCVASMDAFVATLRRFQSGLGSVTTSSGSQYSPLLRPFQTDSAFVVWARQKPYDDVLKAYDKQLSPADELCRRLMSDSQAMKPHHRRDLAADIYYDLSSMAAMGLGNKLDLLSPEEYNPLWQIDNLRQYLSRTATTISTLPAEIAAPLLQTLIDDLDRAAAGRSPETIHLRFAHAETIMPLLSLMRLPSCYYLTHYFDTVHQHWQTWHVVPMAANLQMILFRSHSGALYVRIDVNERPMAIHGRTYLPWPQLRDYLLSLTSVR